MKSYPKGARFHVNLFLKSRGGVSIFFFWEIMIKFQLGNVF